MEFMIGGVTGIDAARWEVGGGRAIGLSGPVVMGILNVTPDSFSDGGEHSGVEAAVARAAAMAGEGAAIVDVGGESTRPGAARVDDREQIRRVVPVIEGIVSAGVVVSVDTTRAAVARAAIDAGAGIVNDVSGGREEPAILGVCAGAGVGVVLMHRLRAPGEDRYSDAYDADGAPDYSGAGGVVEAVRAALGERMAAAEAAGVSRGAIVLDPGLGFGKTVAQNFELVAGARRLLGLGRPLLSGASRKSFVGRAAGVEAPRERVAGTLAVSVAQFLAGVRLFRVHDVRAHVEALAVAAAIADAG